MPGDGRTRMDGDANLEVCNIQYIILSFADGFSFANASH